MAEEISDLLTALQSNLKILEKMKRSLLFESPGIDKTITHTTTTISQLEACMCPICYEYKSNLFETPCNHTFCEDCIMEWLEPMEDEDNDHETCPTCRSALNSTLLRSLERHRKLLIQRATKFTKTKAWRPPVLELTDLVDDRIQTKVRNIQSALPHYGISSCLTALAESSWCAEDALEHIMNEEDEEDGVDKVGKVDVWEVHVVSQSLFRNGQVVYRGTGWNSWLK